MRGTITSLTDRSPAAKTSSMSRRSSLVSDSCAATSPRSSSSLIASRPASGSPPSSRTTTSVDFDSSQMTGRKNVAIRLSGGAKKLAAASVRCSASRLGASSPSTSVTNEMSSVTPTMPMTPARPVLTPVSGSGRVFASSDSVTAPNARGQQRGRRDADLDGGQEPVRVADQPRDGRAPAAALGQRPDLALAQRDQRDLGGDEQALDDDQEQDDADVERAWSSPRRV